MGGLLQALFVLGAFCLLIGITGGPVKLLGFADFGGRLPGRVSRMVAIGLGLCFILISCTQQQRPGTGRQNLDSPRLERHGSAAGGAGRRER